MTKAKANLLHNAKHLLELHPAPWSFYDGVLWGYVQDANDDAVFGGEPNEGYVSDNDEDIVALVDTVNALAVWMTNPL